MKVKMGREVVDVNWSLVDRFVTWANPQAGVERLKSKVLMGSVSGGYTGGKRDRRATRNWRPKQTSANEDLSADLPDLRSRSRDLVRNVPLATGAISTVVTSVVGDGLVLKSQIDRSVLNLTDEQADEWQANAERQFALWAKSPDFSGRLNWDEMQEMALRTVLESGDVLVARRKRVDPSDVYNLKLQFIESDRLSNPNFKQNTTTLFDGVEVDADGRPIKYWISTSHPDSTISGTKREWKGYELGISVTGHPNILHLFKQQRPDQARGIPYLAPVIESIKQIGDYSDAEVRAAVVSSMFTVFVKTANPTGPDDASFLSGVGGSSTAASNLSKDEIEMGAGAIVDLMPGEDVSFANPNRPNTAFESFITAVARHIGVALELPYELLLKSFTSSYSASRAALEQAWQMFRVKRSWLSWKFCQPVYEWVITEAIAKGKISAPGFFSDPIMREAWLGSDWIGPSRIQLDPLKEANADEVDLRLRTKTIEQIITERTGGTFAAKHKQLVKEKNLAIQDGLIQDPKIVAQQKTNQTNGQDAQAKADAQDNQDNTGAN